MAPFRYSSLMNSTQNVRLLKLEELVTNSETLCCTLAEYQLSEAPAYRALSYTWGRAVPPDLPKPYDASRDLPVAKELRSFDDWEERKWPIKINGDDKFYVRRNLRDALIMMAKYHFHQWVWIDAICIDQTNVAERNAQVSMMSQIYSGAVLVVVWLGAEDEMAEETYYLHEIMYLPLLQQLQDHSSNENFVKCHPTDKKYWQLLNIEPTPLQWWWSWCQFYRRGWFERIWIMQEYALAKAVEMRCGSYVYDPESLQLVATHVNESAWRQHLDIKLGPTTPLATIGDTSMAPLADLRNLCIAARSYNRELTVALQACGGNYTGAWLLVMMMKADDRYATDSRDRVYGVMGMVTSLLRQMTGFSGDAFPNIDYSIDPDTLSRKVSAYLLISLPYLVSLSMVQYRRGFLADERRLPSWAMDLENFSPRPSPFALMADNDNVLYNVSKAKHLDAETIRRNRNFLQGPVVRLRGLLVDTVKDIVLDFTDEFSDRLIARGILQLFLDSPLRYLNTSQTIIEAVWRTMIADSTNVCPAKPETIEAFQSWFIFVMFDNGTGLKQSVNQAQELKEVIASNLSLLAQVHSRFGHAAQTLPQVTLVEKMRDLLDEDYEISEEAFAPLRQLVHSYHVNLATSQRKLVTSVDGILALVPSATESGDAIVILEGGKVPFVVRLHNVAQSSNDAEPILGLQIIGEAYVHSIMHGEAIEALEREGVVPWRDFNII